MPPILSLAALGIGVYAGYKILNNSKKQKAARKQQATHNKRGFSQGVNAQKAQTLRKDPVTGVYQVED